MPNPLWQPLARSVLTNPLGTEYAGPSVGMPQGPFNELLAVPPGQAPMMQTDLDRTRQTMQEGGQTAMALALGMTGNAPGASLANPAFAKWFGKSKMVDETGRPQTLYHGSSENFEAFDVGKSGANAGSKYENAIFVTNNPTTASSYAELAGLGHNPGSEGVVYPVHVKAENPYISKLTTYNSVDFAAELAKARRLGHDAVSFPNVTYRGEDGVTAVFNPTQIKSAIGNRGTFSPTDPRITYGAAGLAAGGAAAATQGRNQ